MSLKSSFLGAVLFGAAALTGSCAIFIPIKVGDNLIANPFDQGGNTLDEVIPSAPGNAAFYKYNNSGFTAWTFDDIDLVWTPDGTTKFAPGIGAILTSPIAFTLTLSGSPHVPVLPLELQPGLNLVGCQTNGSCTYDQIVGAAPANNAMVYKYNPGSGHHSTNFASPDYTLYTFTNGGWLTFTNGGWSNAIPTAAAGEAIWIQVPCAPSIACPAPIITNACNNSIAVSYANPAVSGGALSYCTPPSGSTFSLGTAPVTCTATNACGSDTCTFNVTIFARSNKGTNFWLTFPASYAPDATNRPLLSLNMIGAPGTVGEVTIPGLGFESSFTISAGRISTISLPGEADLGELNDSVINKGIHITAESDVAVYALNNGRFASDGYLALPTAVLGTEYIVLSHSDVPTEPPRMNGTQFSIVGTEDGTAVTILPSVSTGGHTAGFPYTITLNEGDTYQLRNTNNPSADLSGTIVSADKPIAVFGGQQCASIANSNSSSCNTMVEQLVPTAAWGTNFVAMPLAKRTGSDSFRFIAVQPGTTVKINGVIAATLERSEFFDRLVSGSAWITSDKPILVTQYAGTTDSGGLTNPVPFMLQILPTTLFRDDYTVFSASNGTSHYVNLVIPDALAGFIDLDGAPIPAGQFVSIPPGGPPSGFSGAQVEVTPGIHTLTQTSPQVVSFGATVYGFGEFEAYGYPAGMQLGDVQPPTIVCPQELRMTMDPALCAALVPGIEAIAHDNCTPDNLLRVSQDPPAGTSAGPGRHTITLTATDRAGNTRTCVTLLTVLDAVPPTITCPGNIDVYASSGQDDEVVTFTAIASSSCNQALPLECEPESGTAFPLGTTVVACAMPDASTNAQCTFTVTVRRLLVTATLQNKTNVVLRWDGPATLESASGIAGPWQALSNATSPLVLPLGQSGQAAQGFFRPRTDRGRLTQSTCNYPNRYRAILFDSFQLISLRRDIYYAKPNFADGLPPASCVGYPMLSAADLANLQLLALRLKLSADPVSSFLKAELSDGTLGVLASYQGSNPYPLQILLAYELNLIMSSQLIYEGARFAGVPLRAETLQLLAQDPQGDDLSLLNRLLLEDAYPMEISRTPGWPAFYCPCKTDRDRDGHRVACRWYEHTYDLYQPVPAIDDCRKRAMIVLIHGGAFEGGSKEELVPQSPWDTPGYPDMQAFAAVFVKAGYVVAVINYRRADPANANSPLLVCSGFQPWLALQDLHAALNHITRHTAGYRVDPDKIFLIGTSAGAVTVLNQVYADDGDLSFWSPWTYSSSGGKSAMDRYPGLPIKIAGIATFSGAILRSAFYDPVNSVPSLMIHGTIDSTVPYCTGGICSRFAPQFGLQYGSAWLIKKIRAESPSPLNLSYFKFYERTNSDHIVIVADHVPYFHAIGNFFADIMDGILPASEPVSGVWPDIPPSHDCVQ